MKTTIFWFRRDLRLNDNTGLFYALRNNKKVLPIFIFDTEILDKLENKLDARVEFIHRHLEEIQKQLGQLESSLYCYHGKALDVFKKIIQEHSIDKVYTNHDYEPNAIKRDLKIKEFLSENSIEFNSYKDQTIFEKNEVIKDDGKPYTIFTPYMRKWKQRLTPYYLRPYPTENYYHHFIRTKQKPLLTLAEIGFKPTSNIFPVSSLTESIIAKYAENRNFPALQNGTSKLSVHLRFGTVSIRDLASRATELNETWLNELIWRDFYMMILWHFPHVDGNAFKPKYDQIEWNRNELEFKRWCDGQTGYPIVDAGMRELNETGFMHNRVRMIVASFLTKHLLIDWRWGEAYFASKLNDFDLSANNGGWQWTAGSGCDAAPYFRIFNPAEQTKKFDAKHEYIKRWVPEYLTSKYPEPMVEHKFARERCLQTYKRALGEIEVDNLQKELF